MKASCVSGYEESVRWCLIRLLLMDRPTEMVSLLLQLGAQADLAVKRMAKEAHGFE
jgi:hypothetical protein